MQLNPWARSTPELSDLGRKLQIEAARAEGTFENLHGNLSHGPTSQHTNPPESCKACRKGA
jgi:hypothetical protein